MFAAKRTDMKGDKQACLSLTLARCEVHMFRRLRSEVGSTADLSLTCKNLTEQKPSTFPLTPPRTPHRIQLTVPEHTEYPYTNRSVQQSKCLQALLEITSFLAAQGTSTSHLLTCLPSDCWIGSPFPKRLDLSF